MIVLAPAKVNLCLFLGPARAPDGRHELVTVFEALSLADRLSVSFGAEADEVICPGVEGPNLAARALAGLRAAGWDAPAVRIRIDKRIPVAAGMGGGSSDAAAVLGLWKGFAGRWELARSLGADVPALLEPGLWLAGGVGDSELVPFPAGVGEHAYVVLPSEAALSTAAVFTEADRLGIARSSGELAALRRRVHAALAGRARWAPELTVNDLAPAALSLCPSIRDGLDALLGAGADQAIVSGSGPTAVGIFWGSGALGRAEEARAALLGRFGRAGTAVSFSPPSQSGPT